MSEPTVYLNGEFLPLDQAHVPVLDRGFIFGDGVYEVIPVYANRLFRVAEHLERLNNSLAAVRIKNPYTDDEWLNIFSHLIEKNQNPDQSLYLQVTRGVAKRDHGFPADTVPTVFVMSSPGVTPDPDLLKRGACAITLDDIRWQFCNIKSITLLPNILLRQQALDAGCAEAILIRNGNVTEGAASNVFVIRDGVIRTPPKDNCVLPGITRDVVIELAHKHGVPCEETTITETDLKNADEIWVTSSTREILPITRLNGNVLGNGEPGQIWQRMYDIYQQHKQQLRNG
jgi:D-alanine transaminase